MKYKDNTVSDINNFNFEFFLNKGEDQSQSIFNVH